MYVRVLASEIGDRLSIPAHLHFLSRTEIGRFDLDSAVSDTSFDSLTMMESPGYSPIDALYFMPSVDLSPKQAEALRHGIAPTIQGKVPVGGNVKLVRPDGHLGAIAEAGPVGMLQLRRVFSDET
jgi:tRNA U55 pseudouridine synthase TruB